MIKPGVKSLLEHDIYTFVSVAAADTFEEVTEHQFEACLQKILLNLFFLGDMKMQPLIVTDVLVLDQMMEVLH